MGKLTKTIEIEQRRTRATQLALEGQTQMEIAELLNVSQATIHLDLKAAREVWREKRLDNVDQKREEELLKINHLERTAWQAWFRSREDAQLERVTTEAGKTTTVLERRGQVGDPRFLDQIRRCIERRCALDDLDKADAATTVLVANVSLTTAQRAAIIHEAITEFCEGDNVVIEGNLIDGGNGHTTNGHTGNGETE